MTVEDDGDEIGVNVDLSNLLGGTLVTLQRLVTQLAVATDASPEAIVSDLRNWLRDDR